MIAEKNSNKNQRYYNILQQLICRGLGIFYGMGLLYIFFLARRRWGPQPKRNINLLLFREKFLFWQTGHMHTRPESIEFYKDLIGNILLFVPFPFFLLYFFRVKSFSKLLMISAGTSLVVEIIQYVLNIGVADIDDLLLNTIGALLGSLMMHGISKSTVQYRLQDKWQTADEL